MNNTIKKIDNTSLVSVRILTYNSSKYIIETLDSIYRQTYHNIELVISDDCSTDDTLSLCEKWIEEKGKRFTKVLLLTTPINTGVCANSKRSLEATTGEWIKGVGGDDCLYPNAIEEYVRFVEEFQCEICAAKMDYMDDNSQDLNVELGGAYVNYMNYIQLPYEKQLRLAKEKVFVPGPVLFYSRKVYETTGGPDPKYGAADEWSFLYNTLKGGFRIFPLDKILVRYRIRQGSITRFENGDLSKATIECNRRFVKEVILKDVLHDRELLLYWHLYIYYMKWGNRKMRFLNLLDPLFYVEKTF